MFLKLVLNMVEESDLEDMFTEGFHPAFEKYSHQTCQHDIIKYYTLEKILISSFSNLNS